MILVTGAGGFVGRHLVAALLAQGVAVRGLDLPGVPAPPPHPLLQWQSADLCAPGIPAAAVAGAEAVVHLAVLVASSDERRNRQVNTEAAGALIDAAEAAGCRRFVLMSAAAAKFRHANAYGRSKRAAEALLHGRGIPHAILRTPLILGRGGEEFDRFVKFVGMLPGVVLVFGNGRAVKRPVHIDDVVAGLIRMLEMAILDGEILELACREPVSLNQFIDEVALRLKGRRKRLHIPLAFSLVLAWLAEALLRERSPVTPDILLGLNEDVDFDVAPTLALLGIEPKPLSQALDQAMSRSTC